MDRVKQQCRQKEDRRNARKKRRGALVSSEATMLLKEAVMVLHIVSICFFFRIFPSGRHGIVGVFQHNIKAELGASSAIVSKSPVIEGRCTTR